MSNPSSQDDQQSKGIGEYRDDPSLFGQSSDVAQHGRSGDYAGGGPDSGDGAFSGPAKGSQEEWRGKPDANAAQKSDNDVGGKSRSDDPGQSSYGGFKNEGPADGANHAEGEHDGGTSKVAPNDPQSPDDRER